MFREFIDHRVQIVSLDGEEFFGMVQDARGDFVKIVEDGNTYIINVKYIGYLKTEHTKQAYQTDQDQEMYPAAGYQYPARVAAKVTPRDNEFSMEMPKPDDAVPGNALGGPQLVRQTTRRDPRNTPEIVERDERRRK